MLAFNSNNNNNNNNMLWRLIVILAACLLWNLPTQLDAFITQSTGCHHNGTWYADKSLVPTMEKCLNCQCQRKTLVCRLKVCPEMPMPPPRGCVVVQKKNTCCPYLSCARLEAFYKLPTTRRIIAYLDHYERESIDRVVNDNMLQRRSDDSDVDLYVCVKNGTVYKSGSAMSSSNLCTYCYCIGGTEKCVKPKCMLPVEGCKPIFVDSTCCPVRYDCTTKTSGKSSQEVRYRKTSNKHFLRMSQRLQRNRGCTVNEQFYAEGQKMKSDADRPCDICFCIRGARRCAPKKCSPALKNCMPVVPKGQCCPSSYDCGSQRDYRRAQNSRQFNLFSLFFGGEGGPGGMGNGTEIPVQYPPDRHPSITAPQKSKIPTLSHTKVNDHNDDDGGVVANTEKSIFDTIREGLEFIDGNNNQMLTDNMDLVEIQKPNQVGINTTIDSTTEISFLDLLLGPESSTGLQNNVDGVADADDDNESPEEKTTTDGYPGISWVDLLLGPDEDEQPSNITSGDTTVSSDTAQTTQLIVGQEEEEQENKESTTNTAAATSIDRIDVDFDDVTGSGEISTDDWNARTTEFTTITDKYETTEMKITDHTTEEDSQPTTIDMTTMTTTTAATSRTTLPIIKGMHPNTTQTTMKTTSASPTKITKITPTTTTTTKRTAIIRVSTTKLPNTNNNRINNSTKSPKEPSIRIKPTKKSNTSMPVPQRPAEKLHKTDSLVLNETIIATTTNNYSTLNAIQPVKRNDLLTALLDGITDILSVEKVGNNKTIIKVQNGNHNRTKVMAVKPPTVVPTPKPLPLFKPIPLNYTRINSKIANLTVNAPLMTNNTSSIQTFKPMPSLDANSNLTVVAATTTTTMNSSSSTQTAITISPTITTNDQVMPSTALVSPIRATITTTTTTTTAATPLPPPTTTTAKQPLLIKPNPILDVEPFDNSAAAVPTLPPSLPNLKIIPFLPTDAVKADRNKLLYDYYHPNGKGHVGKIDYDLYDDASAYPAITERYPTYGDLDQDGSKTEYIYKFNVVGPAASVTSTAGKLDGTVANAAAFVKYDFAGVDGGVGGGSGDTVTGAAAVAAAGTGGIGTVDIVVAMPPKGFSPPTKTEGGFVPKEPLIIDDGDGDEPTKHLIDITTAEPNTTKIIEITTPDPFKDVIKTEPPPDLSSLIEDKEKNPIFKQKLQGPIAIAQVIPMANKSNAIAKPLGNNTNVIVSPTYDKKNTIESFLDLLFRDDDDDELKENDKRMPSLASVMTSTTGIYVTSTIPPFKSLPETSIKLVATTTMPTILAVDDKRETISTKIPNTLKMTSTKMPKRTTNTTAIPTTTRTTTTTRTPTTTLAIPARIKATTQNVTAGIGAPTTITRIKIKSKPTQRINPSRKIIRIVTPTKTTTPPTTTTTTTTTTTPPAIGSSLKYNNTTSRKVIARTTTTTTTSTPATVIRKRPHTTSINIRVPTTTTTSNSSSSSSSNIGSSTTVNPFLMAPFNKLPFMDTSFEVKPQNTATTPIKSSPSSNLLGLVHYKNSLNMFEGLEPAYENYPSIVTATKTTTTPSEHIFNTQQSYSSLSAAATASALSLQSSSSSSSTAASSASSINTSNKEQHQQQQQQTQSQHVSSNSLIDPTGILKLAGCNIYGRMYRVGRIILELSNPCLECKCTEIGVKCGPLDC